MTTKRIIVQTRKSENCTNIQEITHYKYYKPDNIGKFYECSKPDFCEKFYADGTVFTKTSNNEGAECEMKISPNGKKFLQTIGNGTTSDNLLKLPTF